MVRDVDGGANIKADRFERRGRTLRAEDQELPAQFWETIMQELLTAVTYLVVWLICEWVIGIESGLIKLILSLAAAVLIYVWIAVRDHREKKDKKPD